MSRLNSTSTEEQIVSENGQTSAIVKLVNTAGSSSTFVVTATPEGVVTGSIGDVALDSVTGNAYIQTATGNAGWKLQMSSSYGLGYSWFMN